MAGKKGDGMRFCDKCGKEMPTRIVGILCYYKGKPIYERECVKGHPFSSSLLGLNI